MRRRHELTDEQWAAIEPSVPGREGDPGRHGVDNRLFLDAVLYVAKTGIPWRDLPERFGRWNSVWRRFDRWCASGVWATLADALGDADLEELHLDSTSIKAQHAAAGSRTRPGEKKTKRT
jgi:transposase